jgi:peroxiredoxin
MSLKKTTRRIPGRLVPARSGRTPSDHAASHRPIAEQHYLLKVGAHAPAIVLENAIAATVDVRLAPQEGPPVIITFYRGGCCPYCNLELKAYQEILPQIEAAGASPVAISPEKPHDTLSTTEKNALTFDILQRRWPESRTSIRLGL